jgi:hypothetical protein
MPERPAATPGVPLYRRVRLGYLRPAFHAVSVSLLLRLQILLLAMACTVASYAQQNDVPLQRDFYIDVERNASLRSSTVHSGLKPVIESRADLTNVMGFREDSTKYYWPGMEKVFRDHLIMVREGDFKLDIDPLFGFEIGEHFGQTTAYTDTNRLFHNMRGFRIKGDLGSKVSFQTMFHENQALVPEYLFKQVIATGVLSGQGRTKIVAQRKLDYGWSQANVSYSPADFLNVQFGHGKHFVGHGYRSVLLSDHAINSPYLKFSFLTRSKKLQYTTWHTKLMHGVKQADRLPTGNSSESLFYWMRARMNHLSLHLGRFDIGVFESTIFQNIDDEGVRPFDPLELNPVMGVNTLVNGFDGPYKSLMGLDLRVKLRDKLYLYGQFATDRPQEERYAWQAGVRMFDLIRRDIHLQLEYNAAQPFMYQHTPEQLAFMHAGLPLAHPMGAYFSELVAILDLGFGRVIGQAKLNLATYNRDRNSSQNHGSDLTRPELPVLSPEGPLVQELTYLDLNVSYLVNPVSNLRLMLGMWRRDLTPGEVAEQTTYVYFTLRTNLFNRYYDI